MSSIAVLILFFEKADQTIDCVKSFLSSGVPIYILNNGSSERSTNIVNDFCSGNENVQIFKSERNLGVSRGRNYLINRTKEEWLFFVDNDITIKDESWLPKIIRHISNNNSKDVFIPKLFNIHENQYSKHPSVVIENENGFLADPDNISEPNAFPGGASIVRRSVFETLGRYDDDIFVGFEDYEFAIRAVKKGCSLNCMVIEDVELSHFHKKVTAKEDKYSVEKRYDHDEHERSVNIIFEKHGVILNTGWRSWLLTQKNLTSGSLLVRIGIYLKSFLSNRKIFRIISGMLKGRK